MGRAPSAPRFVDREDAGWRLAERLAALPLGHPQILALPRGGVVVAGPVAASLHAPLEALVVRKLGVPWQPELAMGALAEDGTMVLDRSVMAAAGIDAGALERVVAAERGEIARRIARYREGRPLPSLEGRTVVVVDDGVATGSTVTAGVRAARNLGATRVIVAVPVGAPESLAALAEEVDEVVALSRPARLRAVGEWYDRFASVPDPKVIEILRHARAAGAAPWVTPEA